MIAGADINPEDQQAIKDQRKTLYQGLWWGGERIWLEDMVRLKRNRKDLPTEALGEPSEPGAMDRAVMLKIRSALVFQRRRVLRLTVAQSDHAGNVSGLYP